jgi:hypothetical protein
MQSPLPHSCYIPCSSNPPCYRIEYSWRTAQVLWLLIMQFSPASRQFIPLWPKNYPQHSVLKHPQSKLLPYFQRPSFAPHSEPRAKL